MMRKVVCILCIPILIAALILTAGATETGGSIRLMLDTGELPVIQGAFTLYRVGSTISDGYRIEEAYGGGFVRQEDALSPHLAQWLADMTEKQGCTMLLDVDGNAEFFQVEDGLYLLTQTERTDGFYPIQPFLVTVPMGREKNISLYLEPLPMVAASPPTGQDPTPYIGAFGLVVSLVGMLLCTKGKGRR